jgi:hypothetical protein
VLADDEGCHLFFYDLSASVFWLERAAARLSAVLAAGGGNCQLLNL